MFQQGLVVGVGCRDRKFFVVADLFSLGQQLAMGCAGRLWQSFMMIRGRGAARLQLRSFDWCRLGLMQPVVVRCINLNLQPMCYGQFVIGLN